MKRVPPPDQRGCLLRVESPVIMKSREAQVEVLRALISHGVDEGLSLVESRMASTLAWIGFRAQEGMAKN